jgi:phenylacetate-CoA ligase
MKMVANTRKDLYTSFVSGLIFPLHERMKNHSSVALRKEMESTQWWDEARLRETQLKKLRRLLAHAGTHVPYYRQLFEEKHIHVAQFHSLADLQQLPILDKPTIRANIDQLKADNAVSLIRFSTGGSTGEPLSFYVSKERISHDVAAKWRATRWWDVDIGDSEIVVWGSPIELRAQDNVRAMRDRFLNTKLISAFDLSERGLDRFLDEIRTRRPKMLFGYPTVFSHIARHAQQKGVRLDDLGIMVAFVTSEVLYDEQRAQISKVFGCAVANGYGGRDAGFIAHECPEGGMHITAEDIVVEIVDSKGAQLPRGQPGEVIVTHLATRDFPFIRYRTGDVGVLDTTRCSCGRGLPLIKEIRGRTTDFLLAHDGTMVHSAAVAYILRELPQVRAFKIIQETMEHTRVLVVADGGTGPALQQKITTGFQKWLGKDVHISVEEVEDIPAEKSGKFRYVVNKIADPSGRLYAVHE